MQELTDYQKKIVGKMRALARPATSAELHNGSKFHISTTRNTLLALEGMKIVRRKGVGRATTYVVKPPVPLAARKPIAPTKQRWVLLVDGEAIIVEAAEVRVFPERGAR